ncbi:MAG: hypothetical protein ACE5FT_00055 [Candidatus Nanoarchaeia archaeon]
MKDNELRERLIRLSDTKFLSLFRALLDKKSYPYPDSVVLDDRYMAITVLLADVPIDRLLSSIMEYANN